MKEKTVKLMWMIALSLLANTVGHALIK